MACRAAEAYASTQAAKIIRVRDGQHMINQLRDVASDLHRQQDKIRAVYDAREVCRSADRLEDTLKNVFELMRDVEATVLMFGKKKGFDDRISALVHDIGTHANALLAATSLAIADRYRAGMENRAAERPTVRHFDYYCTFLGWYLLKTPSLLNVMTHEKAPVDNVTQSHRTE